MSGIVGSYFNTRGSGVVAKLGTDGQVFTSSGAGVSQDFEAAAGGGKINQVVQTLKQDVFTNTTEDAWVDITDMSCAITPSASDSKIIIQLSLYGGVNTPVTPSVQILRDIDGGGYSNLATSSGTAASNRKAATCGTFNSGDGNQCQSLSSTTIDEPSTTDEVTYKLQLWQDNTSTTNIGASGGDSDAAHQNRYPNTITLLEVLA